MPEHGTRRIKYTTLHIIAAAVEGESSNMYFRDVSYGLFGFQDVTVVARSLIYRANAEIRKLLSGHLTDVNTVGSIHYF